jgi:hypothetical protein
LGPICFARMGDHVAVDVGELVASRVGEAAGLVSGAKEETEALIGMVECRICQEEDLRKNLESPCACNGSLKVRAGLLLFKPEILGPSSHLAYAVCLWFILLSIHR